MPQNATVLIAHGPYEACGHVDWRTSRLDGLKCMYMHLLIPRIITLLSLYMYYYVQYMYIGLSLYMYYYVQYLYIGLSLYMYYYVQYMYIGLSLKKEFVFWCILSANAYYSTIRTNR